MCDYDEMSMTVMAQWNARALDTGECVEPETITPTGVLE